MTNTRFASIITQEQNHPQCFRFGKHDGMPFSEFIKRKDAGAYTRWFLNSDISTNTINQDKFALTKYISKIQLALVKEENGIDLLDDDITIALSWCDRFNEGPVELSTTELRGDDYIFTFGKHKGRKLSEVFEYDPGYLVWLYHKNSEMLGEFERVKESEGLNEALAKHTTKDLGAIEVFLFLLTKE